MFKTIGFLLVIGVLVYPCLGFAQVVGQEVLVQPVIINGQQVQGVLVVENGTVRTNMCSSPQQYVTVDQSSSGWACFESTTGTWLLHALPPQTQTTYVYQQPPVYASGPVIPTYPSFYSPYSYYPYPYYSYYPYYPVFVGPRFGIGIGFGSFGIGRPIVVGRGPVVIGRPFNGSGRPFIASRPIGGLRSVGPGRFSGRSGRR